MMTGAQRKSPGWFRVEIKDLESGPLELDREIPLEWLMERLVDYEYEAKPLSARAGIFVEMTGNGILVRGDATATIKTFCGCCLRDIEMEIRTPVNTYLVPRAELEAAVKKSELTPEDLNRECYEGDELSLDDLIGDAIMLELPMSPRCSGDCPGLPIISNADARKTALDPRLAPLASIRLNKEN